MFSVLRSSSDDAEATTVSRAEFYDVGGFVRGRYEGARLILAIVHVEGQEKVECSDCRIDGDLIQRYAFKDGMMTRLTLLSDESPGEAALDAAIHSFSSSLPTLLGMKPASDGEYSEPSSLRAPSRLNVGGTCLTLYGETTSVPKSANATGERLDPFGPVFRDGRESWFSRPDGTAASYYFRPPNFIEIGPYGDQYICRREMGKEDYTPMDEAYSADAELFADSVPLAHSTELGEIFTVKTLAHPLVRDLRQQWIQSYPFYDEADQRLSLPSAPRLTDEQYLALHPVIFWRGPLSEAFACIYLPFDNPMMAEPVIYLYSPTKQAVHISLDSGIRIAASKPKMAARGWNVVASPGGRISAGLESFPYLFWEGRYRVIPPPERGDVVARDEVPAYLDRALAARGLSTREASDFKAYWTPKLTRAPYYIIAFYDAQDMRFLAPLTIEPRPDTLIRVLMDSQPLSEKISVPAGPPPRFIDRYGFTVIEWGGIER